MRLGSFSKRVSTLCLLGSVGLWRVAAGRGAVATQVKGHLYADCPSGQSPECQSDQ